MNSLERMTGFLAGGKVDRIPFMPILMRFCAKHTHTPYRDFILDPAAHCRSNIDCARAFGSDWVNVMSDPFGELEAYGAQIEYPADSLPLDRVVLFDSATAMRTLPELDFNHGRLRGRIAEVEIFRRELGDTQLICGWVEGAVAEYCDLRGLGNACLDFYDDPEAVRTALTVIYANAEAFAIRQIAAGAHMIGVGDAACSQLGPELYEEFGWQYECRLVECIHRHGALAKLHICGNTTAILPRMIATGADVIDVDHLVTEMAPFAALLRPGQALCGNLDPVMMQNSTPERIRQAARNASAQAAGRLILSGGCEITPDTPEANLRALAEAALP